MGYTASVLGASGYSGGELLRLLSTHPAVEVVAVAAGSKAGRDVADAHPHLAGIFDGRFQSIDAALGREVDVCFSCLPRSELPRHLGSVRAALVVDLADDHRDAGDWTYGLTEFARPALRSAARIANPGCYPTAVLLATLPFASADLIGGPVVVDAISGVSGAGRQLEDRLLFATASDSAAPYGDIPHRHVPEMERGLSSFGGLNATISFTPHLAPIARGLLATVRAPLAEPLDDAAAFATLGRAYDDEPFVIVTEGWPSTKAVRGTNMTHVGARVDQRAGFLVASAAIDNLGKGAAGQALQNANVALGLDETTGLQGTAVWP